MIVVTHQGAKSPLVGRVKGITVGPHVRGPSVAAAMVDALQRFTIEKDAFLFVASGGRINSARVWPILKDRDWDVAAYVDRIGGPQKSSAFDGIGRVSLDTLLVRPTDAGRRVVARWDQRNAVAPGMESINLSIALRETGVPFLHLSREWIWREDEMRALDSSAMPVVEFGDAPTEERSGTASKVSELSTAARKPEESKPLGPGVLWVGHLYQYTGYGKANREILFRLANSMAVRIDDSHKEPVYVKEDLRSRLDVHKNVLVAPRAPLLRMMGPDHISQGVRHRIVWTMQETSVKVHEDMVKRTNANFDEIWTPSAWNLDVFKRSGVRIPGYVMPLGVDPVVFRPVGRHPLPPCRLISTSRRGKIDSPDGFVFLTVGLPGFRKGWDVVADAAELAFKGRRNVHVVIALTHSPPAWNEKVYRQFASYKVPIWTLEGSFDEHDLARIYCGTNAYVSASRGEGFNLPAAEAAACGLPVIVPDNTCHTEIFGPEAFLFKPDGVKAYPEGDWISDWYKGQLFSRFGVPAVRRLAEILEAVALDGPVARDRAVKLREKIVTDYTWDVSAARAAERLLEVQPNA